MAPSSEKFANNDLESARLAPGHFAVKPQVDLSHHFSDVAKSRINSPLKDIFKYMAIPGERI